MDRLELGFGANGIGNRINWRDWCWKRYTLQSLVLGGDFVEQRLAAPYSEFRVELPVDYTANAAYHWTSVSAVAEVANGFYLLRAADRDEATKLASMIPASTVQLRRLAGVAGL